MQQDEALPEVSIATRDTSNYRWVSSGSGDRQRQQVASVVLVNFRLSREQCGTGNKLLAKELIVDVGFRLGDGNFNKMLVRH